VRKGLTNNIVTEKFVSPNMVYGVIQNFIQGLKYRGGWRGLLEHMYTVR
jgi:hypothetical protein